MSASYDQFLESKTHVIQAAGFEVESLNPALFPFQSDIVRWALRLGRAAIFAGTGLGKTLMQLEWAYRVHKQTNGNVLILAPLAVSHQTVNEGAKFGIEVNYCKSQSDVKPGITITNYEKLHKFNPALFIAIVLDEASILKSYDGKTRTLIIEAFENTPYRLSCTATPSPNDFMELGNQCQFLGVMSRTEMLAKYFVHDGGDTSKWRLKGHAEEEFWKWVATWAVMLRKPSDLGYNDDGFILPTLHMHEIIIPANGPSDGYLFAMEARTLEEQRAARKSSMKPRIDKCAEVVKEHGDKWLIWCDLNPEGDGLEKAIPSAVQVAGKDTDEFKEKAMLEFAAGKIPILISKAKLCGFGMNFQVCANMAFVGISWSFESFFQAIRRIWRFGQLREVRVYIIISESEGAVLAGIKRKEADADRMAAMMVKYMAEVNKANLKATQWQQLEYKPTKEMAIPEWLVSEVA